MECKSGTDANEGEILMLYHVLRDVSLVGIQDGCTDIGVIPIDLYNTIVW